MRALEARQDSAAIDALAAMGKSTTRPTESELRLAATIANEHGVSVASLFSRSRRPGPTLARHHFAAVVRWSTGRSYPEIGAMLRQDHTTIMAAVRHWDAILNGPEVQ